MNIIEKNLELMKNSNRGGMSYVEVNESFGGNAGYWEGESCCGVNFYCTDEGEIIYFGNYQDVPKAIREKFKSGSFRVTLRSQIVESYLEGIPKKARKNIEESVRLHNERLNQTAKHLTERV